MSQANRFINSPLFGEFGPFFVLAKKNTNKKKKRRIGGPHRVYKPVRGRDANLPPFP